MQFLIKLSYLDIKFKLEDTLKNDPRSWLGGYMYMSVCVCVCDYGTVFRFL